MSNSGDIVAKIKEQIEWQGPSGKHLGHVVIPRADAQKLLTMLETKLDELTTEFVKARPAPSTLPDCMLGISTEPCKGYVELYGSFAIKGGT